jgi:hypothetical protein
MKKMILMLVALTSSFCLIAQDFNTKGYAVKELGSKFSIDEITNAIEAANWCSYRYQNKRQVLTFKSGIIIELYSVNELNNSSINIDQNCVLPDSIVLKDEFAIHEASKKILRLRTKVSSK